MKTARPVYFPTVVILVVMFAVAGPTQAQWPQWGGPSRDFRVKTKWLADKWPEDGPPRLWSRELGDGYSSIVVDDGVLYTMYHAEKAEYTIALDDETGKTIWQHKNPSPFKGTEFGPGPHATPLIVGDRLFAVGAKAVLHCFDKKTGNILWKHDLPEEYGAPIPYFGYACSPIAYKDMVILPVDRKRSPEQAGSSASDATEGDAKEKPEAQSLMAFDQATGRVVWKAQDYPIDYTSPILINFKGQDQLVLILRKEVIGVDPNNGELLWHQPVKQLPDENIATPLFNGEDLLFCSAAYSSGSRVIKLTKEEEKTVPRELWYSRKLRILQGNAIPIGDYVYGTSGDFGPAFFVAMNIETGKPAWRKRGFKKATFVYGDGKLIALEEDGHLTLTTVTPEDLKLHSKCKVADGRTWTTPTLVGTTLYVRDRKHIMAFDLGSAESRAQARETKEIIEKARAALKAVKCGRYKGRYKGDGWVKQYVPDIEGRAMVGELSEYDVARFHCELKLTPANSEETVELTAGSDGDLYYLVDSKTKTVYADMDEAVLGSQYRGIRRLLLWEFAAKEPLEDVLKAENVVLAESATVDGEACYQIRVIQSERREVTWFISKKDYLPRRVYRLYKNDKDEIGSTQLELADLRTDTKLDASLFQMTVPPGYTRTDDFAP